MSFWYLINFLHFLSNAYDEFEHYLFAWCISVAIAHFLIAKVLHNVYEFMCLSLPDIFFPSDKILIFKSVRKVLRLTRKHFCACPTRSDCMSNTFWSVFSLMWTEYEETRSIHFKCRKIQTRKIWIWTPFTQCEVPSWPIYNTYLKLSFSGDSLKIFTSASDSVAPGDFAWLMRLFAILVTIFYSF